MIITPRVDLTLPMLFKFDGFIKLGGLVRFRDRAFDVRRFRFQPSDNIEAKGVTLSSPPEQLFETNNIAPRVFELRESTRETDNYSADHFIYSSYLMFDTALTKKWQLMSGLRLGIL